MTKILTQPLVFLLLLQIAASILCWRRLRNRKSLYPPLAVLSLGVFLLTVLSMPVVGDLLQDSVTLQPPPGNAAPDYVVVLSGGLNQGISPDLDVLNTETTKRVLFGVRYWKM